jgi:hypothetical protein
VRRRSCRYGQADYMICELRSIWRNGWRRSIRLPGQMQAFGQTSAVPQYLRLATCPRNSRLTVFCDSAERHATVSRHPGRGVNRTRTRRKTRQITTASPVMASAVAVEVAENQESRFESESPTACDKKKSDRNPP